MKLLFVENRYATWLMEAVARKLCTDGHSIHWIVQNPTFKPRFGKVYVIPFPCRGASLTGDGWTEVYRRVASSDRQVQYFGGGHSHYPHYVAHLGSILDVVCPDVVFGESTQFYELLTVEWCRRRHIPYLFPVTIGYPPGRMCFLAYDTRTPIGGDGSRFSNAQGIELIDLINTRRRLPTYMDAPRIGSIARHCRTASDRARVLVGWLKGERFATPSPMRKLAVEWRHRQARRLWDLAAVNRPSDGRPYVLYALQVQPECAIDVWGWPWRDQGKIIERAAKTLEPRGIVLVVKPNPRSKYEISTSLLEVLRRQENVRPIAHCVSMREVFPQSIAVLGVTGSVLLEGVFAGKESFSVGAGALSGYPGISCIATPEDLVRVLDGSSDWPRRNARNGALELINWLSAASYPGDIFEPLFDGAKLVRGATVDQIVAAFRDIVARLDSGSVSVDPEIGRSAAQVS